MEGLELPDLEVISLPGDERAAQDHPHPYRSPLAFTAGPSTTRLKCGQLHRQLPLPNPCLTGAQLAVVSH